VQVQPSQIAAEADACHAGQAVGTFWARVPGGPPTTPVLARLGASPSDLLDADVSRPPAPTFAEYIPNVSAAVSDGTRRVYGSYARAASPTRNTRPTQKRPASCAANVNPPATTGLWTACRCGLHTETACRRGGTLALRPADLDRTSA
jgi:hypothetical protein